MSLSMLNQLAWFLVLVTMLSAALAMQAAVAEQVVEASVEGPDSGGGGSGSAARVRSRSRSAVRKASEAKVPST